MLIYPFLSCNGQLELKKGFIISGRAQMLFLLGEGVIRYIYVRRPVAATYALFPLVHV